MYKRHPPPEGYGLLDEFHSPGGTARYVREIGDGWHHVVDVDGFGGGGSYRVHESIERGIFEESPDGSRPYIHTEVREHRTVAEGFGEEEAFDLAWSVMRGADSGDFDFTGGFL